MNWKLNDFLPPGLSAIMDTLDQEFGEKIIAVGRSVPARLLAANYLHYKYHERFIELLNEAVDKWIKETKSLLSKGELV